MPGRRQFFQYRDLGVTEATGGKMRAQGRPQNRPWIVRPGGTITPATCSSSIILSGWVDLEFAGGRKERFGVGDSVMIPGGLPHQETATSEDLELIEVSVPAEMGTEACDPA